MFACFSFLFITNRCKRIPFDGYIMFVVVLLFERRVLSFLQVEAKCPFVCGVWCAYYVVKFFWVKGLFCHGIHIQRDMRKKGKTP